MLGTKREVAQRRAVRNTPVLSTFFAPRAAATAADAPAAPAAQTAPTAAAAAAETIVTSTRHYSAIELPSALMCEQEALGDEPTRSLYTFVLRKRLAFGRGLDEQSDPTAWLVSNTVRVYIDTSVRAQDVPRTRRACDDAKCAFVHIPINPRHTTRGKAHETLVCVLKQMARFFLDLRKLYAPGAIYVTYDRGGGGTAATLAIALVTVVHRCSALHAGAHISWCHERGSSSRITSNSTVAERDTLIRRTIRMLPESDCLRKAAHALALELRQQSVYATTTAPTAATTLRLLLKLPSGTLLGTGMLNNDTLEQWLTSPGEIAGAPPRQRRRCDISSSNSSFRSAPREFVTAVDNRDFLVDYFAVNGDGMPIVRNKRRAVGPYDGI